MKAFLAGYFSKMQQLLSKFNHWVEKYRHFDLICLTIIGYAAAIILSEDHYTIRILTYFPLLLLLLITLTISFFIPQQIREIYHKTLLFVGTLTAALLLVWIV